MNIILRTFFIHLLIFAGVFAQPIESVVGKLDRYQKENQSTNPGFELTFTVRNGEYNEIQIKPSFSESRFFVKNLSKNNNLLWIKKSNRIPEQKGFACWTIDEHSQSIIISFGSDFLGPNDILTVDLGCSAAPIALESLTIGSIFINQVNQKQFVPRPIQIKNR